MRIDFWLSKKCFLNENSNLPYHCQFIQAMELKVQTDFARNIGSDRKNDFVWSTSLNTHWKSLL